MQPRYSLVDLFSTFLTFAADRLGGWVTDPKLHRHMQTCLKQMPQTESSEEFWALYWHKRWQTQPSRLIEGHLSAYLQETCYWAVHKTTSRFSSTQWKLSDCFQVAIAELPRILKACDPDQRASLKTYSSVAFGNIVRDALRQRQEIDFCNDWSLLLKLSRKRLQAVLQAAGLSADTIARYLLAWTCFESAYVLTKAPRVRPQPDSTTWETIAQLYNAERLKQFGAAEPECDRSTLEKWLTYCASRSRAYLYPQVGSLNTPKFSQESGELQDDLADATRDSPLATIIAQEEMAERQLQQSQLHRVLTTALDALDAQTQSLLQLYYQQELTQQQIAKQLDIQQYTVSRRLSKAREGLLLTLTRWSQNTLHISPTSNVVKHISTLLEAWLQEYYTAGDRLEEAQ